LTFLVHLGSSVVVVAVAVAAVVVVVVVVVVVLENFVEVVVVELRVVNLDSLVAQNLI
jgi:hypothetical protein